MPSISKPEPRRRLQVFLCHASDDKPAVRGLYHRLLSDGVEPWLDEESLLPGQTWENEIPKAVKNSDIVLVCLSRSSVTKAGYVQKEIKYALDVADQQPEGAIFIIPLRLEECEVPERLKRYHWADLFNENGYNKLMRALRASTNHIVVIDPPSLKEHKVSLTHPSEVSTELPRRSSEQTSPSAEDYTFLTQSQARLLYAIWKYEFSGRSGITAGELAEELMVSSGRVRKIIHSLSRMYLWIRRNRASSKNKKGRPIVSYELNKENIIIYPETALILLKLEDFPQDSPFRIDREQFERYLIEHFNFNEGYVKSRIDAAIIAKYIQAAIPGYIYPSSRIANERVYLESVARHYNVKKK